MRIMATPDCRWIVDRLRWKKLSATRRSVIPTPIPEGRLLFGRHHELLVLIPIETDGSTIVPISVHATTRQQIRLRLHSGRFRV